MHNQMTKTMKTIKATFTVTEHDDGSVTFDELSFTGCSKPAIDAVSTMLSVGDLQVQVDKLRDALLASKHDTSVINGQLEACKSECAEATDALRKQQQGECYQVSKYYLLWLVLLIADNVQDLHVDLYKLHDKWHSLSEAAKLHIVEQLSNNVGIDADKLKADIEQSMHQIYVIMSV